MAVGYSQPQWLAYISFNTAPLATPSYTPIADLVVEGLTVRRGRSDETGAMQAGRCTFSLLNTDRSYDPTFTSGTYYGKLLPMKRVLLYGLWSGVYYPVFTGYIESITPDFDKLGRSIARFTCVDAFGTFFARQNIGGEVYLTKVPNTTTVYIPYVDPSVAASYTIVLQTLPQPIKRKIRATFTGTVASPFGIRISVIGEDASGVYTTESFTLANGAVNPTGATSVAMKTIDYLVVEAVFATSFGSDAGKPLVVYIDNDFPAEYSGDALTTLLNATSWRSTDRAIENGKQLLQTYSVNGGSVLSYAQRIADSEGGTLFMSKDGKVTFYNRHHRLLTNTTATFGGGVGEYPFEDITLSYDDSSLYNTIRVQRDGGVEQVAQDSTSVANYFPRTLQRSGLLMSSDASALSNASFLLGLYKDPALRVRSLSLRGEVDPANLWPILLGAELGNQYVVKHAPPTGATISQTVILEGINITVNRAEEITIEWSLSPSQAGRYWVLGTSALGSSTRLAY